MGSRLFAVPVSSSPTTYESISREARSFWSLAASMQNHRRELMHSPHPAACYEEVGVDEAIGTGPDCDPLPA